jgi:hypothetical protein
VRGAATVSSDGRGARRTLLALAAVGTLQAAAHAQEQSPPGTPQPDRLDFALTGGVVGSDNIARASANEDDGTITRAGFSLDWNQDSSRLKTNVDSNLYYEHYSDNVYEDDWLGGFAGQMRFGIVPDRFEWMLQDNFGQIISDPFVADTPENRENVNFITTGPDFTMAIGGDNKLTILARYSQAQYETDALDNTQTGGGITFQHTLSSASSASLNFLTEHIELGDGAALSSYDRQSLFLRYEAHGRRTGLTFDAGYTRMDMGDEKPDGFLGRLQLRRTLSPSSSINLGVGTQFSDSSQLFREGQTAQGSSNLGMRAEASSVVGVNDPFRSDYLTFGYDFDRHRTTLSIEAQLDKETYQTQSQFDRKLTILGAHFTRHLGPSVDLGMFVRDQKEDFDNQGFEDDELEGGVFVDWLLGRKLTVRVQYQRIDRDSTGTSGDFAENQVSLFASWAPIGRR